MPREGKTYCLKNLLQETPLVIPRIQRDYVQSRDTHRIVKNRKHFIKTLCNCVCSGDSINLNYVYGYMIENYKTHSEKMPVFVPIDGQQRLTTLFLLHYYVYSLTESREDLLKELNNKLIYETRESTNRFFKLLFNNKIIISHEKRPSAIIRESGLYSSEWDLDPSVKSCLVVLDEIHNNLKSVYGYNINNLDKISFMKLDIEGLSKPNELYIKMNSRGKQLSSFEGFKSELVEYLDTHIRELKTNYVKKLDGEWLDLLWDYWDDKNNSVKIDTTDSIFKEIFHWIIINSYVASKGMLPKLEAEQGDLLSSANDAYLEDYRGFYLNDNGSDEDLTGITEALTDVSNTLDLLSDLRNNHRDVFDDCSERVFGIKKGESEFNFSSYPSRTLLFILTTWAKKYKGQNDLLDFEDYWRILRNSVRSSEIDKEKNFIDAIKLIKDFDWVEWKNKVNDCRSNFTPERVTLSFNNERITELEDIIKYKLIKLSSEWKQSIYDAESNDYFNGEIFFVLKLSKIFNIEDIESADLSLFKKNWKAVKEILSNNGGDTTDHLLHRTLLCYGDYYDYTSQYDNNSNGFVRLCYNDNKHHAEDWRGMLRRDNGFKAFRKLVSDYLNHDCNEFTSFCNSKIESVVLSDSAETKFDDNLNPIICDQLKILLIKDKRFFDYISGYYRLHYYYKEDNKNNIFWYLMPISDRGRYINYLLYALYLELKAHNEITDLQYIEATSKNGKIDSLQFSKNDVIYSIKYPFECPRFIINNNADEAFEFTTIEECKNHILD